MTSTPYDVPFRVDKDNESLCRKTLGAKDLKKFRKAVKDDYYFQMYYDDLPIWGFIGKIEKILKPGAPEMRYYLFTHVHFDISYNRDRGRRDQREHRSAPHRRHHRGRIGQRRVLLQRQVEGDAHPVRAAHGEVLAVLVPSPAPGDPLVFHHQLARPPCCC